MRKIKTLTTFILVEEETEDNLHHIENVCKTTAEARGFTDVDVTAAYATPECIVDIPSEVLHDAITYAAHIVIAFTDFNIPGVEDDREQKVHRSNETDTQE